MTKVKVKNPLYSGKYKGQKENWYAFYLFVRGIKTADEAIEAMRL